MKGVCFVGEGSAEGLGKGLGEGACRRTLDKWIMWGCVWGFLVKKVGTCISPLNGVLFVDFILIER
jgi:hypothetical protein